MNVYIIFFVLTESNGGPRDQNRAQLTSRVCGQYPVKLAGPSVPWAYNRPPWRSADRTHWRADGTSHRSTASTRLRTVHRPCSQLSVCDARMSGLADRNMAVSTYAGRTHCTRTPGPQLCRRRSRVKWTHSSSKSADSFSRNFYNGGRAVVVCALRRAPSTTERMAGLHGTDASLKSTSQNDPKVRCPSRGELGAAVTISKITSPSIYGISIQYKTNVEKISIRKCGKS